MGLEIYSTVEYNENPDPIPVTAEIEWRAGSVFAGLILEIIAAFSLLHRKRILSIAIYASFAIKIEAHTSTNEFDGDGMVMTYMESW